MKNRILLLCCLLQFALVKGWNLQQAALKRPPLFDWQKDFRIGPRFGYSWQGHGAIDVGAHILLLAAPYKGTNSGYEYEDPKRFRPYGFWNAGCAIEFPFNNDRFTIGPKIFSEINIGALSTAINVTTYFNAEHVDLRVTPEIGIGLAGYFSFRYGYNFAPTGIKIDTIGQHRITIVLVLVAPRIHEM